MPSFSVDSTGQRIRTDILVTGYARDVMNKFQIAIPDEIIGLCFLFWFITISDEFDESLSNSQWVDIDGSCAKLNDNYECGRRGIWCCTVFGSQIVKSGVFKWCLKFKTEINWSCIGIVIDKKEELEKNKHNNDYGRHAGSGCFWFGSNGWLFHCGDKILIILRATLNKVLSLK